MHITLHLTDNCNLACSYCYAKPGQAVLPVATAVNAIEECAQEDNCGIIFFGGEPLLHKDKINRIIEWCESEHPDQYHFKITTNGLLLDENDFDFALKHKLHIALSHDGIKKAHDLFRVDSQGKGSFDLLLPKLQLLLAKLPYSPVMMTINPQNVEYYAESVEWFQSLGVQYLIASLNYAGNWDQPSLRKLKKQYQLLAKWHFNNYKQEKKIYFSPFDKRIASHIFPDRTNSCKLGYRQISIGPDGTYYPCVQFVGLPEYAIGSTIEGIDENRRMELYEINEYDKSCCQGCQLSKRCHNKCGCLNLQTTGHIDNIPPVLCEHERIIFPIVDRLAEKLFKLRTPMFIQRHYNSAFPVMSFLEDL